MLLNMHTDNLFYGHMLNDYNCFYKWFESWQKHKICGLNASFYICYLKAKGWLYYSYFLSHILCYACEIDLSRLNHSVRLHYSHAPYIAFVH